MNFVRFDFTSYWGGKAYSIENPIDRYIVHISMSSNRRHKNEKIWESFQMHCDSLKQASKYRRRNLILKIQTYTQDSYIDQKPRSRLKKKLTHDASSTSNGPVFQCLKKLASANPLSEYLPRECNKLNDKKCTFPSHIFKEKEIRRRPVYPPPSWQSSFHKQAFAIPKPPRKHGGRISCTSIYSHHIPPSQ